jgi:hypothetical protein
MSARVLIAGQLLGETVTRPTKMGRQVILAKVRVAGGNHIEYWSLPTFAEAPREELDGLHGGDGVLAIGDLTAEPYERNGETRVRLKILLDRVLALKGEAANPLPRTGTVYASAREAAASSWTPPASGEHAHG